MATIDPVLPAGDGARERILEAAYALFSRHGTRAVGNRPDHRRGGHREDDAVPHSRPRTSSSWPSWSARGALDAGLAPGGGRAARHDPAERLLAIFDVFGEWFARPEFERCAFVTTLLEVEDREHPVHRASVAHLANIRAFLQLPEEAGVKDPDHVARQWHILMKGSIVAAAEGDTRAAARAREVGALLLERHGVAV